jgi:peptidoglycan-N-acetylglucosamine deacetylase
MKVVKPPFWVRSYLSRYTWNMGKGEKSVYLTFDDGPTPRVTEWVLGQLAQFKAKATFFCIGRNVEREKHLFQKIIDAGHSVGNHTYSHLNGLRTGNQQYFDDIALAQQFIRSNLFRPPYGLIKRSQGKKLVQRYKTIMWDVMSYDFLQVADPGSCFLNVKKKVGKGSIVVFHDSDKAWENLKVALPLTLDYLVNNGYQLKPIV